MLTNNNSSSTRTNRSAFTANQWQELEHQALIYKYMVSGVPIPTELIFSVKRSLESSLASRIFPHQSIGWGCYQVGYGRKTDPEPGRCRRTDGKKWRCSKEAYPDSKYCERHMHRGRNRSRKPVEQQQLNSNTSTSTSVTLGGGPLISSSSCNNNNNNNNLSASSTSPSPNSASPYSFSPLSSSPTAVIDHSQLFNTQNTNIRTTSDHFPYPHNSSSNSSSRPSVVAASGSSTHNLFLDSASATHVDHKDYSRYFHGMTREGSSDEKSLFPESSGNIRSFQDSYNNLAMASSNNNYNKTFSQSQFETLAAAESTSKQQHDQQQQQQHCFVLGTDFKSSSTSTTRQIKLEKDSEKSLHHFFGEWPPKNNSSESWLDLSSTTSRLHSDG